MDHSCPYCGVSTNQRCLTDEDADRCSMSPQNMKRKKDRLQQTLLSLSLKVDEETLSILQVLPQYMKLEELCKELVRIRDAKNTLGI